MDQFFIVLTQIGIFFILILTGIGTVRFKILDERALGNVSKLVMRVLLPSFIFINTAEGATRAGLAESLAVIPLTIAMYAVLFGLSYLIERVFHMTGNRRKVFRAIVMFGNVGFMGIPLVTVLYPNTALLYISLLTILDQGLFWTYGVSLTQPVRAPGEAKPKFSLKGLKNVLSPALAAILLATILVLLDWHLPSVIITALDKLGGASMPMSLIYIGGMLSLVDVRRVLKCKELYAEIALKMIALPIAFYFIMTLLPIPSDMAGTMAFIAGLPAINIVAMLSKANGSDGDYAVCAVMLTTIACLVTLPIVSLGIALIG